MASHAVQPTEFPIPREDSAVNAGGDDIIVCFIACSKLRFPPLNYHSMPVTPRRRGFHPRAISSISHACCFSSNTINRADHRIPQITPVQFTTWPLTCQIQVPGWFAQFLKTSFLGVTVCLRGPQKAGEAYKGLHKEMHHVMRDALVFLHPPQYHPWEPYCTPNSILRLSGTFLA